MFLAFSLLAINIAGSPALLSLTSYGQFISDTISLTVKPVLVPKLYASCFILSPYSNNLIIPK